MDNIILLTDFDEGHYVGQMKLVINKIAPSANILDLSNKIEPQNIKQAAFILKKSIKFFAHNSLIQVVVDPGVGSSRNIILAELYNNISILAPNNGVLSLFWDEINSLYEFQDSKLIPWEVSNTFHGRDIFSPLSAKIFLGEKDKYFKTIMKNRLELINIDPISIGYKALGEILYHDNFGNAVTNLEVTEKFNKIIRFREKKFEILDTFSNVQDGRTLAYLGSMGTIELAIRNGNFKERFNSFAGEKISLTFSED